MRLIETHPLNPQWFKDRQLIVISETHYPPTEHDPNAYWVYLVKKEQ